VRADLDRSALLAVLGLLFLLRRAADEDDCSASSTDLAAGSASSATRSMGTREGRRLCQLCASTLHFRCSNRGNRIPDAVGRHLERAWISLNDVVELPDGRLWLRWDEEIPDVCPMCSAAWADHPGGIEIRAVDGHLGRVLPECPQRTDQAPRNPP
jgi:hypothetical protein